MLLQYLKIKENDQKKKARLFYNKIIKEVEHFTKKSNFSLKNEFNTTFELTIMLLFIVFHINKSNFKEINQYIMDIFIEDLDFSFRKIGIGDMSIGKYVKKHVNKIYFRFKKFEKIFKDNNFDEFEFFLSKIDILKSNEKQDEFSVYLYEYIKNNLKKTNLKESFFFLLVDSM
tara:strand:+ start:630 stop:1148 length:519 start_codon:yes stop_codon:yes gene_type:complete